MTCLHCFRQVAHIIEIIEKTQDTLITVFFSKVFQCLGMVASPAADGVVKVVAAGILGVPDSNSGLRRAIAKLKVFSAPTQTHFFVEAAKLVENTTVN